MRQRNFARSTRRSKGMSGGTVASQYLADSASPSGHSISSHSSSPGSARHSSRWGARTRTRAKRDASAPAAPSRQEIVCQLAAGRPSASALTLTGWCSASRRMSFGGRPRPDHGTGGIGRPDLLQRDLRLGQKSNRLGDAGRGAALGISGPLQRQIQAPGDRQARRMIGQRQADRNLTVVPLAELAAILTRHPDRMASLLRKAGVVDDPGFDRAAAFDNRQGQLLYPAENPLV